MHVGDLVTEEPTDQHVIRIANRSGEPENCLPLRVAPPASVYALASDGLGEVWNWPAGALEDHTMAADKGKGSSRGHFGMSACGFRRSLTDRA
jgi:hypothetical protein